MCDGVPVVFNFMFQLIVADDTRLKLGKSVRPFRHFFFLFLPQLQSFTRCHCHFSFPPFKFFPVGLFVCLFVCFAAGVLIRRLVAV